jgi:hypothetical protein
MFLSVLLRSHHTLISAMAARMEADPGELLQSRMMRSVYLQLVADPIARPLDLGDGEVLGRLAHEAAATLGGIGEQRDAIAREQVELLRASGAMRTDLDVAAQLYALTAVGAGYFLRRRDAAGPGRSDRARRPARPLDRVRAGDRGAADRRAGPVRRGPLPQLGHPHPGGGPPPIAVSREEFS